MYSKSIRGVGGAKGDWGVAESQKQQEGGHPGPRGPKEVIFTMTPPALPPRVWVVVVVVGRCSSSLVSLLH